VTEVIQPKGGATVREPAFRLAVVNHGGRDPDQAFPDGPGSPDAGGHPPVNYHAYAAATRGWFCCSADSVPPDAGGVLVLMRRRIRYAEEAVKLLKGRGFRVMVAWKEAGSIQVAEQLAGPARLVRFRSICAMADGAVASTPDLVALYGGAGARRVDFLPTPYPVDDPRWDFDVPVEQRQGVWIGTRDFETPSRNHRAALIAARSFGVPVTVTNFDGNRGRKWIAETGIEPAEIIEERLGYPDYLRRVARHRIVFQLDRSRVPGQVAGDAALCGVPCVGGDGAVDELLLPERPDPARLLADDPYYAEIVRGIAGRARGLLAFQVLAKRLAAFFAGEPQATVG
jgi:hypothetical protein